MCSKSFVFCYSVFHSLFVGIFFLVLKYYYIIRKPEHRPLILLWLRTRINIPAETAARQQSNRNSVAWMSQMCGEWRDVFKRTLTLIQRVPVQYHGSKIPCVKFGAIKIIPSHHLHQEYLTINLGNNCD